jgi:hypothetical protein
LKSGSKKERTAGASPELERWQVAMLEAVARSPLARAATFGGATALAAVYLHHRRSEDIDLFLPRDATRAEIAIVTPARATATTSAAWTMKFHGSNTSIP